MKTLILSVSILLWQVRKFKNQMNKFWNENGRTDTWENQKFYAQESRGG